MILWIIAVCIAAPLLQEQLILATLPVSRADNEGWNAYHALASTSPSALYPDPRSLVQNNYPPLSFYVTRWLAPQGGDVLMAGRLLSVLGLLLAAFGASRVAKHAGAGSVGMLAIPIAIALAAGAPFGGYVGMNDPQWFGHGLQLLGVSLCFTRSRAGVVLAALLMSAGVLCKQLLVVLPLATFAAFILANRVRDAMVFAATGLAVAMLSIGLLSTVFGLYGLASVVGSRTVAWFRVLDGMQWWLPALVPCWLMAVLAPPGTTVPELRDPFADQLLRTWTLAAVIAFIVFARGEGVNYNVAFDLLLGASVLATVTIARIVNRPESSSAWLGGALLILVMPTASSLGSLRWLHQLGTDRNLIPADIDATRGDVLLLRALGPTTICENTTLCFWSGVPFAFDHWGARQIMARSITVRRQFEARIAHCEFSAIQLKSVPPLHEVRLDQALVDSIAAHYQAVRVSRNGSILRPSRCVGTAPTPKV